MPLIDKLPISHNRRALIQKSETDYTKMLHNRTTKGGRLQTAFVYLNESPKASDGTYFRQIAEIKRAFKNVSSSCSWSQFNVTQTTQIKKPQLLVCADAVFETETFLHMPARKVFPNTVSESNLQM